MTRHRLDGTGNGVVVIPEHKPRLSGRGWLIEWLPGRPLAVDLFCCQGGTSMGYWLAGFNILGVDSEPQPHYPFPFVQADALTFDLPPDTALVAASPPCQRWSTATVDQDSYPDLIPETRDKLIASGLPYVIENVPGAPLRPSVMLCGSMFGELSVIRHRLFESNLPLTAPSECKHHRQTYNPYNTKAGRKWVTVTGTGPVNARLWQWAMDISWMTTRGLSQAIPPPYTEHIGRQVIGCL